MNPSNPPKEQRKTNHSRGIRKMGLSLMALGLIVITVGAAALLQGSGEESNLRNILLPAFGIALCASGFYTWRNAKD